MNAIAQFDAINDALARLRVIELALYRETRDDVRLDDEQRHGLTLVVEGVRQDIARAAEALRDPGGDG